MVPLKAYVNPSQVHVDVVAANKDELLRAIAARMASPELGLDAATIADLLSARERLASTGVGLGIAIPHASTPVLLEPLVALFRPREAVPFDAVDGDPVRLVAVVLAPASQQALHLRLLARIARMLCTERVRDALLAAETADEAYSCLDLTDMP